MVSWSDLRALQKQWRCILKSKRVMDCYSNERPDGSTSISPGYDPRKRSRLEEYPSANPKPQLGFEGDTLIQIDSSSSVGSATLTGSENGDEEYPDSRRDGIDSEASTEIVSDSDSESEEGEVGSSKGSLPVDGKVLCGPLCDTLVASPGVGGKETTDPRNLPKNSPRAEDCCMKQAEAERNDKRPYVNEFDLGKGHKWATAVELPSGSWAEAEWDLLSRLSLRGFEPLVPNGWRLDFPTFPAPLFSTLGTKNPFIRSLKGRDFRAIKALKELTSMGPRVRDTQLSGNRSEPPMKRTLDSFIHWALRDADLHNRPRMIPTYTVHALGKNRTIGSAVESIVHDLITLANRYRQAWRLQRSVESASENDVESDGQHFDEFEDRTFPVLTGFLICGPVVGIITLNSDPTTRRKLDPEASARLIARFDFSEPGQDVWNALAVAIAVIRMRKTTLQLAQEGLGEPMWETDGLSAVMRRDEDA